MTIADTYRLSSRYADDSGTVFMTGLQALARLPIEQLRADRLAGLRTAAFVSGYPGSPVGGYDGDLSRAIEQAPDLPIVLAPALNEEQAVTAVMGSQLAMLRPDSRYDGVVGVFYGKAPGVDRAGDALRHAVFAGTDPRGGAVVIAGDDPAAKSSTIPSSSAGTLADKHIPVLYPGTPREALDLGRHAVYLSRATGLWTSLKIVADVADGSGTVHLDPLRVDPVIPTVDGAPYRHTPDGRLLTPETVDAEREIYEVRHALAIEYAALNHLNHATVNPSDAWIGIVASGITYRELREALRRLGLGDDAELSAAGIRLMCMHMPIPFSPQRARNFARGLEEIFVVEEKQPNIESLMKDALYNQLRRPRVTGKFDEHDAMLLPGHGGLTADDLLDPLRRRLSERIGERLAPEQPRRELIPLGTDVARTPYFCSGCPHNRSTKVPEGAAVGAGIGCHTMTLLMDSDGFGDIVGLTCMGQEGAQWIGMAPFVETPHIFQNIGDGTYFHSGQLAIQGAIAAGLDVTYKLLWNRTVAMTGGQDPQGMLGVAEVCRVLLAQGVARVLVTTEDLARYRGADLPEGVDVWPRDRLMEAQELLAGVSGVTVLIHDQQCAAEARRGRKRGTVAVPRQRGVHQRADLRGLRGLRLHQQLPVGAARRDPVRAQDPHRPDDLQPGLLVPGGRLPVVHDGDRAGAAAFLAAPGHRSGPPPVARHEGPGPCGARRSSRPGACRPDRRPVGPHHRHRRHRRGHGQPGDRHRGHVRRLRGAGPRPDRAVAEGRAGGERPAPVPGAPRPPATASARARPTSCWPSTSWERRRRRE